MRPLDRDTALALNKRLLHNLVSDSTDTAAGEMRLPAETFCCPRRLAREREHLFTRVPQPVAFSAEIAAPGSFMALDVLDTPVLLTRDGAGDLYAFINSCAHRGAALTSGSGRRGRLVCPFHGWTYGLDGRLASRPGDAYFSTPAEECSLHPLPVSEKYGLVVVGTSSSLSADQVDTALDEIGPELASFALHTYRPIERRQLNVEANWKLVTDLSLESYHFRSLHRDSVARVLAPNAIVDTWSRHSRWAFPLTTIRRLEDLDESLWPDSIEGSCTYTLYPGVMVIVNALGAQMIRAEPGDTPGHSRVIYAGVARGDCDLEEARQAYDFGGDVFAGEDLPIAGQCQRGLVASQRDLLLGRNEPLLQFWHALWRAAAG